MNVILNSLIFRIFLILFAFSFFSSKILAFDAVTGEIITNEEANEYCQSVGGTPELFKFSTLGNGTLRTTGVEQFWCNLHIGVDLTDKTDVHSYIEVKTLANKELTLVKYALAHPQAFTPPGGGKNPAYYYCRQISGTLPGIVEQYDQVGWVKNIYSPDMYGGCVFADLSTIDQWTLTYAQHNPEFASALLEKFQSP